MRKFGLLMSFLFLTLLNYVLSAGFYGQMGMAERFVSASSSINELTLTRQALSTIIGWLMIKVMVCGITTGNFVFILRRKGTYHLLSLGKPILASAIVSIFIEVVSINLWIPIPFHLVCFVLLCLTQVEEVSLLQAAVHSNALDAHQKSARQKKAA